MIWHPVHKALYVDVPKTASTTLLDTLKKRYGFLERGRHRQSMPSDIEPDLIIASIRNPYARAVSYFNYMKSKANDNEEIRGQSKWSFDRYSEWLADGVEKDNFWRPVSQSSFLSFLPRDPDCLIRVEKLRRDFSRLPFVEGSPKLPHLNISVRRKWVKYLTKRSEAAIFAWAEDDFEKFGYGRHLWS